MGWIQAIINAIVPSEEERRAAEDARAREEAERQQAEQTAAQEVQVQSQVNQAIQQALTQAASLGVSDPRQFEEQAVSALESKLIQGNTDTGAEALTLEGKEEIHAAIERYATLNAGVNPVVNQAEESHADTVLHPSIPRSKEHHQQQNSSFPRRDFFDKRPMGDSGE